jgi:hypothetical protein
MARVTEKWSGIQYQPRTSAVRIFEVDGVNNEAEAALAAGIPQAGMSHPQEATLLAGEPSVRGSLTLWEVTVSYTSMEWGGIGATSASYLALPPDMEWEDSQSDEPIEIDADGRPIVNSVGDPMDPPAQRPFTTMFLTMTRWQSGYDVAQAIQFINTVNAAQVNVPRAGIVSPGMMLCKSIRPTQTLPAWGLFLARVGYRFEFRTAFSVIETEGVVSPFDHRLLDKGNRGRYDPGFKSGDFFDSTVTKVGQPIRLDGQGKPVDTIYTVGGTNSPVFTLPRVIDDARTEVRGAGVSRAVFLRYRKYLAMDFNALGLF